MPVIKDPATEKPINSPTRLSAIPATAISETLDRLILRIGSIISVVWGVLVLVIVYNVIMRYGFSRGSIFMEELQWHIYGIGFIVALSFSMTTDAHIRVDLVNSFFSLKAQVWIEILGLLLLFAPFVGTMIYFSLPFVESSFISGEVSNSPGGVPYRWIIKSFLPIGFTLLALAGIARLSRCLSFLISANHDGK